MPSKSVVEKALASIRKRRANYDYFFERLDSPDWLAPLRDAGLFRTPPPAERVGDMISFPGWGEATYLARIASRAPDAVLDVLLRLPETDNIRVHDELASVALALPPTLAEKWARKELLWLKEQQAFYFLPERLTQLVVHLAAGGRGDAALALAGELFEVQPEPDISRVVRDIRVKMEDWEYVDLLRRLRPVLVATLGMQGFEFFATLLGAASEALEPESGGRYSYGWRPAIEDHEQNVGNRPVDDLVSLTRDAAECLVLGNVAKPTDMARRLLDRGGVFARIGLHILRRFVGQAEELVARCIGDRDYFDSLDVRHEYDALMEAADGRLPSEVVDTVLSWVEEGPGWIARRQESGVPEDQIERGIQFWQRDRLYPMRNALPVKWQQRYADLVAAVGEPDHPGFTAYHRSWVGPTSPKSVEELRTLSLDDLLGFLTTWRPKDDWMEPSEDGLGRLLEQVVLAEPERFVANCERFKTVDPTYVRSVLAGVAAVVKAGKAIDWSPVLRLCAWVMEQPRAIPGRKPSRTMDRDPDWGWTRKQIADLLVSSLELRPNGIPIVDRQATWQLIEALSKDSDPEKILNEQSSMDPFTQSLNTVRGQTMHAVMHYALWVRRDGSAEEAEPSRRGLPPEVATLLEGALNPETEPSEAVRSVFGRWFWMLAELDSNWLTTRIEKIFPDADLHLGLRRAAWETYLSLTRPTAPLLKLLRDQYSWAVSRLAVPDEAAKRPHFANPRERLAEHLMALYWWGEVEAETTAGLLREFFEKADPKLREHALSFVGRSLHGTPADKAVAESVGRAKALFERRLALATEKPKVLGAEFRGFGWWFSASAIDLDWRFKQVAGVLSVAPDLEGSFLVVEELTKHVEQRPFDVLDAVERLLRCDNPWWLVLGSRARFEAILSTALRHENATVRERAAGVVHHLGAQGHNGFRHLLGARRQGTS
jgi:hypothetical protein